MSRNLLIHDKEVKSISTTPLNYRIGKFLQFKGNGILIEMIDNVLNFTNLESNNSRNLTDQLSTLITDEKIKKLISESLDLRALAFQIIDSISSDYFLTNRLMGLLTDDHLFNKNLAEKVGEKSILLGTAAVATPIVASAVIKIIIERREEILSILGINPHNESKKSIPTMLQFVLDDCVASETGMQKISVKINVKNQSNYQINLSRNNSIIWRCNSSLETVEHNLKTYTREGDSFALTIIHPSETSIVYASCEVTEMDPEEYSKLYDDDFNSLDQVTTSGNVELLDFYFGCVGVLLCNSPSIVNPKLHITSLASTIIFSASFLVGEGAESVLSVDGAMSPSLQFVLNNGSVEVKIGEEVATLCSLTVNVWNKLKVVINDGYIMMKCNQGKVTRKLPSQITIIKPRLVILKNSFYLDCWSLKYSKY